MANNDDEDSGTDKGPLPIIPLDDIVKTNEGEAQRIERREQEERRDRDRDDRDDRQRKR